MDIIRFGDLYSIPSSNGVSRPSAVRGNGFKMINMGELFANNIINDIPMERVELSLKEQEKFLVKNNDLLFARQSLVAEGAGKCSIVSCINEKTTFESHIIRVRLNEKICNPWFYYYLFQLKYNPIKSIVNQCAQAGIRGKELQKIKVPLPIIDTQDKIAEILLNYDNLIKNNNKRIKILEDMAESLYKEWFVKSGSKNKIKLIDLLDNHFNGGWGKDIKELKATNSGYVIRGTDIPEILSSNYDNIPLRYHSDKDIKGKQLLENDIIMELSNGNINNIGRTLFVTKDLLNRFNNLMSASFCKTLRFKNKKDAVSALLLIQYLQNSGKMFLYKNTGTNGINNFNFRRFLKQDISILDDEVYLKVVDIMDLTNNLREKNFNLIKQRDALLPRLMSGKLEVK